MTHADFPVSLDDARDHVLQTQNPSIAQLQSKFRLGYHAASALIEQLRTEQVILSLWPSRDTGLHPDYRRVYPPRIQGDERLNYIERVAQLSIFFFELAEEDSDGHSELVQVQLPAGGLPWKEVRRLFRREWYGDRKLSITEGALAFHSWLCQQEAAPVERDGIEAAIRARCLPYERPFTAVRDPRLILDRAYVRLARFFRRMAREDITGHSRVVDWLVPPAEVPQNAKQPGKHGEHVVPCAVLRDIAIACFEDYWSVYDVAALLRRLLVLIWIEPGAKDLLDNGHDHLRDRMPAGWQTPTGCLYARLHAKGIVFTPAPGYECTCAP
jgi:hypothetical protein